MSRSPEFRQRPRHGLLSVMCAVLVALGCVAVAQVCAQASVDLTATLSVAADSADPSAPAGTTADEPDARHFGTDVLQALGACMVALTGVVVLIAARRTPALILLRSPPQLVRTLTRHTAPTVHHGAPPHALCVIRV